MVKVSYNQKPYRRIMMETWGATCVASPSTETQAGRDALAKDPQSTGSLGLAISEAVEDAVTHDNTNYSLGIVLKHVFLHQTIIGQECIKHMEIAGYYPDNLVGCVGGGSNFGGFAIPFLKDKLSGKKKDLRCIAVEPTACPSLTKACMSLIMAMSPEWHPIAKMVHSGHAFMPPPVHAGGLRYHGMSPLISYLHKNKLIESTCCFSENQSLRPAFKFAVPRNPAAPESNHAIRVAIDEALACKESGESKVILFNLSGHDISIWQLMDEYLSGKLTDYEILMIRSGKRSKHYQK